MNETQFVTLRAPLQQSLQVTHTIASNECVWECVGMGVGGCQGWENQICAWAMEGNRDHSTASSLNADPGV